MSTPIITNMLTKPATVQTLKLRLLNSASDMMGSFARRSASTNSTPPATAAAPNPTMTGEVHSYSTPPHAVASVSAVSAAASATVPHTSNVAFSTLCRGFGRQMTAVTMATAASGTLIQKHQRQPRVSVNRPPRSGPMTIGTA